MVDSTNLSCNKPVMSFNFPQDSQSDFQCDIQCVLLNNDVILLSANTFSITSGEWNYDSKVTLETNIQNYATYFCMFL